MSDRDTTETRTEQGSPQEQEDPTLVEEEDAALKRMSSPEQLSASEHATSIQREFASKHMPSRRSFIVGGAALVACGLIGSALHPLLSQADVLRPPGSVDEEDFVARCIRCNRCVSACPTDILEPMGIEGGLIQMRTPQLHYSRNYEPCIFCDECWHVCPTEAIGPVDPYAPLEGRIGVAIIHTSQCLAYLNAGACGICVEACPYEALDLDVQQRPLVKSDYCNGCGECVKICPAASLTSYSGAGRAIEVVTEKSFVRIRGDAL